MEHENGLTDMINNLVKIIQKLEFIGKDGRGLLMIDKDLADRVFTVPKVTEQ